MGELLKPVRNKLNHIPFAAMLLMAAVLAVIPTIMALSGCGSGSEDAGSATDTATATTTAEPRTTTNPPARTIQSIEQEVSTIRGLPIQHEIAVSYVTRDELRLEMKAQLDKEFSGAEVATEEKVLKELGMLARGEDLAAEVEQMLGEETAGYYDDETGQLKLVSEKPELNAMNQITLSHEVTHALQDQNFSLAAVLPEDSSNDDRDLARLALVEGDASQVEEDFTSDNMGAVDMLSVLLGSLGAVGGMSGSPYLDDSLMFPYTEGLDFVSVLYGRGGWQAVDGAYQKLPESTEQILHPEKYLAGEAPVAVPAPDEYALAAAGWQNAYANVLGEFGLTQLLSVELSSSKARQAAAGWAGDGITYYERADGATALVLKSAWDSEADATEFQQAMSQSLEKRYSARFNSVSGAAAALTTPDGVWRLQQMGTSVVLVKAPDAAATEQLLAAAAQ